MLESIRHSQKGSVYSTEFRRGSSRAVAQACPGKTETQGTDCRESSLPSTMNSISEIFIRLWSLFRDLDGCALTAKSD